MGITPTEFVVLGLIVRHQPVSTYDLKARVAQSVGIFWPIPHAQLYRSTARLTAEGLIAEVVESTGRARHILSATDDGVVALTGWLAADLDSDTQIRDPALLKLAFADLGPQGTLRDLALGQIAAHRRWLDVYESRARELSDLDAATPSRRRLLAAGRALERAYVTYWEQLAAADQAGG